MRELGPRLTAAADFVRAGSRMADIGTDHAYLPVFLVATGKCPAAIASDVREGPAASARRAVAEAALEQKISVRVGDGLLTVQPCETDDIVIAGMGGETIAAILQAAPWVKDTRLQLVLQPMSKPEKLRRFLFENGFAIVQETAVKEDGHPYTVLSVRYCGAAPSFTQADCVLGKLPHTAEGILFVEKQRIRLQKRLNGLPPREEYAEERERLADVLASVDSWLSPDVKTEI